MNGSSTSYVAIVDDDESVCRSLGRLLRIAGYQHVTYVSAESFLEDRKRPRFDCLVLDVQLGGISGLELRQRLAAVSDNTPVVFITAFDNEEVRTQVEASVCVGYFRKTDPGSLVINAIRAAIHAARQNPFKSP